MESQHARLNESRAGYLKAVRTMADAGQRAEILTAFLAEAESYAALVRDVRDEALIHAMAQGASPRALATRVGMSKTHLVGVRQRFIRRPEELVARFEEHRRRFGQHLEPAMVVKVVDMKTVYVSPLYERTFGRTLEMINATPGATAFLNVHPDDQEAITALKAANVVGGRGMYEITARLRTETDEWLRVHNNVSVLTDPETGEVTFINRMTVIEQSSISDAG